MVRFGSTTKGGEKRYRRSGKSMCFLPKSLASMDQAPGPIIARAAPRAACMRRIHGSLECEKYRERAIHTLTMAASVPATGVHKPIRRSIPATAPMVGRTAAIVGGASSRLAIPKWMRTAAVSTRKSKRPTPGQPLANVENSLCKTLPFTG